MPYRQKIAWALEVARIVEGLHQHGIVHGDLKVANVLVADEGSLRLCDFGCSFLVSKGPFDAVPRCANSLNALLQRSSVQNA